MSDDSSREIKRVGYGRPPTHSRFQKGCSGNPRGRQKGVDNFLTDLRHSLGIPVNVNENGKSKRVSTQKALLLRAREKALKGENRALENLLDLARVHNTPENVTIGGGQQDEDGNQMDLRRLTDEELKELDRIMTKAYGISSDPPSRDTIGLPPSRCDRAERN